MSLPYIPSPNMGLTIPIVGVDSGPDYANNINNCLTIIDSHNHGPGQGQPISPSGLSITSDLTIQGNNLTNVRTTRFISQPGALGLTGGDQTCIYAAGGELWYNDAGLNQVQITQSGSVKGSAGTITGMGGTTAGAAYNNGSSTFVFTSASNVAANLDCGTVFLRLSSSGSNYYSLSPPSPLSSNATVTLPPVPASGTQIVVLNNSGNMGTQTPDTVASNMTSTGANAIAASMNATGADAVAASMDATGANSVASKWTTVPATQANAVGTGMNSSGANAVGQSMTATGVNSLSNQRTRTVSSNAPAGGVAISSGSGAYSSASTAFVPGTGASLTVSTGHRPVMVCLVPDGSSNNAFIGATIAGGFASSVDLVNTTSSTIIGRWEVYGNNPGNPVTPVILQGIDTSVSGGGTYTYQARVVSGSGNTVYLQYYKLVAYEL